jgi:YHS domain-containing protein
MDWLTQNWIWILVVVLALVMFRRMGHHGYGGLAHHGFGHPGDMTSDGGSSGAPSGVGNGAPGAAIDPVSGNALRTDHAITSFYRGRVYYFENEETRRRFEAEPQRFATVGSGVDPRGADESRPHRRHGC